MQRSDNNNLIVPTLETLTHGHVHTHIPNALTIYAVGSEHRKTVCVLVFSLFPSEEYSGNEECGEVSGVFKSFLLVFQL